MNNEKKKNIALFLFRDYNVSFMMRDHFTVIK